MKTLYVPSYLTVNPRLLVTVTDRLFLTILTPKKIVSLHKMHSAVENVKQSIGRQLNCGKLDLIKEAFHIK